MLWTAEYLNFLENKVLVGAVNQAWLGPAALGLKERLPSLLSCHPYCPAAASVGGLMGAFLRAVLSCIPTNKRLLGHTS